MKDIILKYVTMADILGEPVSLRINKETTSKTFIGGILTILLVIAIIVIFWVFAKDMLNHENPTIAEETQIFNNRPSITLNKTTVQIAFSITDNGSGIIDNPSYFKFRITFISNINTANSTSVIQDLKLKKCTYDDFPIISEESFYGISMDKMYCIENFNVTIGGFWDDLEVQYLTIELLYCVNETSIGNCSELSEIKRFLKENPYYFNIFLTNTQINPKDYSNPITNYVISNYAKIGNNFSKTIYLFIKNQQLHSDDSILFNSDIRENSTAFDYLDKDLSEMGGDNVLISCNVYASNKFITYHRTYKKISEVLADVGGLSSVFFLALKVFCYFFTNVRHDEIILNKIFDYDLDTVENEFHLNQSINIQLKNVLNKASARDSDEIQTIKTIRVKNSLNSSRSSSSNTPSDKFDENYENKEENIRRRSQNILNIININRIQALNNLSIHSIESNMILESNKNPKVNESIIKGRKLDPLPKGNTQINERNNSNEPKEQNKRPSVDSIAVKKILTTKDKYKLHFSFCEIVKAFCFRCLIDRKTQKKLILYKKSEAVLDNFLDIGYIVHKLDEYEKLKLIVMSKEQLALFNFISKDIVSVNNNLVSSSTFNEMREFNKDEETLAKLIIKFIEKLSRETDESNIPEVDKKLFNFLHNEIKRSILIT